MIEVRSAVPEVRLLALDADGTLVDPDGVVRPAVKKAVKRARDSGIVVVVCTGRRFRSALPVLEALELEGPVVVHNGVLVKDIESGRTTNDDFLPTDLFAPVVNLMRGVAPPMVYVDRFFDGIDLYAEPGHRAHAFQAEYLSSNPGDVHEVDSIAAVSSEAVVMISSMADETSLGNLKQRVDQEFGDRVQTNFITNTAYRGHILEVARAGVSKWTALERLCRDLGVAAAEVAAIGDDTNDIDMIANVGIGIAMGNGVEAVKRVADWTTESNARDGVAIAIDRLLRRGAPARHTGS